MRARTAAARSWLLRRLDEWRFWMVVAFLGLVVVGMLLFTTLRREGESRAAAAQARAIAVAGRDAAVAERRASADARYRQCLDSMPLLNRVNAFFDSTRATLLRNAIDGHRVTPPGTAAYRQQAINIRRLRRNLSLRLPVPTTKECAKLRARLLSAPKPRIR